MLCLQLVPGPIDPAPKQMARSELKAIWSEKMPKPLVQGWARKLDRMPGGQVHYQQEDPPSPAMGWLETMRSWIARSRQRRALGELAELNDRLLQDIGVAQDAARREAAKPFWQR